MKKPKSRLAVLIHSNFPQRHDGRRRRYLDFYFIGEVVDVTGWLGGTTSNGLGRPLGGGTGSVNINTQNEEIRNTKPALIHSTQAS